MSGNETREQRVSRSKEDVKDGSVSDSVVAFDDKKKRRSSIGEKVASLVGLHKFHKFHQNLPG